MLAHHLPYSTYSTTLLLQLLMH